MNIERANCVFPVERLQELRRDGDNREFVINCLLPIMGVRPEVKRVIRWAYGYDDSPMSYEELSDGSSLVPDFFMGRRLKEPFGVAHDMLFAWHREGRADPKGHHWTLREANLWYYRAAIDFGYPELAVTRLIGLSLGSWVYWHANAFTRALRTLRWSK